LSAFLIILGVPFLGALLYVAEHVRQTGQTPSTRSWGLALVLLSAAALGAAGVLTLLDTVIWIASGEHVRSLALAVVTFVAQTLAGGLMLWAARCAWRVYRLPPLSFEMMADASTERASEQLRLSATLLMLVPLLLLVAFGVLIALPVVLAGVAYRITRLGRQAQLLWTLALAVRQDLPLAEEVEVFAEPLWKRQHNRYVHLADRLRDGRSLGEALELTPGILPRSVAAEVRMAEQAGRLPQVLAELAAAATTALGRSRIDNTVAITLLYGWVLLSMFLVVVSFLMYWIIPKYKDIFNDFGVELPQLTISLIEASDAFFDNFLVVMPMIGLPLIAAGVIAVVYFVSWGDLNLPLLMRWFPRQDAPSLLRTLSHAVSAGQPLPQLVEEMAHRQLRSDMRTRLMRLSEVLQRGEPLWVPLCNEGFIKPLEGEALAAAQRAGNLPWAMRTLAEGMLRSSRRRSLFWLEILKPTVVIGVGLIVGWFVVAMFLPLVKLIVALA
jgi:type II secretory pathway component PulF